MFSSFSPLYVCPRNAPHRARPRASRWRVPICPRRAPAAPRAPTVLPADRTRNARFVLSSRSSPQRHKGPFAANQPDSNLCDPGGGASFPTPSTYSPSSRDTTLLTNATIWLGDGETVYYGYSILFSDVVLDIFADGSQSPSADRTIDVHGRVVTPGLVDMHSHAGVDNFPFLTGNDDVNEATAPLFPQLRALDAFDHEDMAIPNILAGGVTAGQILPGSANVMGGEGFRVKYRWGRTANDMWLPVSGQRRVLKMACGENPKRVYGAHRDETPESRMGSAWLMRSKFEAARLLNKQQAEWCEQGDDEAPFPVDLSLAGIQDLLQGMASLNVHCYQTHDMEMVIRLADEFNFTISAFHHALEAYKLGDELERHDITVATFSDLGGYKAEAYDASVHAPAKLHSQGVKVALKTDHPVTNARDLITEAAKAHFYGMPEQAAFAAVTSVPAAAIGVSSRLGELKSGKDADVVVWDGHPLRIGAQPEFVFVDGQPAFNNQRWPEWDSFTNRRLDMDLEPARFPAQHYDVSLSHTGGWCSLARSSAYAVTGLHGVFGSPHVTALPDERLSYLDKAVNDTTYCIIVVNGAVANVTREYVPNECTVPAGTHVINATGGIATPGLVNYGAGVGLVDIGAEVRTHDGHASAGAGANNAHVRAIDGMQLRQGKWTDRAANSQIRHSDPLFKQYRGRNVHAAWAGGVTTVVEPPAGSALVAGQTAAVTLAPSSTSAFDAVASSSAGVHFNIGHASKDGGLTGSTSGQFAVLRDLLRTVAASADATDASSADYLKLHPIRQAIDGDKPAIFAANQADHIAAVLDLATAYPNMDIVIYGGAEAHMVADELADAGAVVVLAPPRCVPFQTWDGLACTDDGAMRLAEAGVRVVLAVDDEGLVRNLRWEAGMIRERARKVAAKYGASAAGGLDSTAGALATVTSNVAAAFDLAASGVGSIRIGQQANFNVFSGDPLDFTGSLIVAAVGREIDCNPQQF